MTAEGATKPGVEEARWSFLTNHGHVLLALHCDPDLRQRDIAHAVGISEGGVKRILQDLYTCGYLEVRRIGRRNHYEVNANHSLRHPLEASHTVGELLHKLAPAELPTVEAEHVA